MKKTMLTAACLIGAAQAMATDVESDPAEAPGWCKTYDPARMLLGPGDGMCPPEGDCDLPDVRDTYLTTQDTPFLVVRMHIQLFRADDGSDPTASEADVIERMAELNRAYFPHRVRFVYTWQFRDDSQYRYGGDDDQMKIEYAVDPHRQCNFYVRGNGQSAYGYFPWWDDATGPLGGVVCGSPFFTDAIDVATHEMGHNLGLWHTHHGVSEVQDCSPCYERADGQDGDTTGDFASDTPATPINTTCNDPAGTDSCSGVPWGDTLPESYMSYGFFDPDPCWALFTPQQGARMQCWIQARLSGWLACAGDFDDDGDTGFLDVLSLLEAWGPCDACNQDIDGNGVVGFNDLLILLAGWGPCV